MAKKRTPEQEAIRAAKKLPERRACFSRRMCWGWGHWPCKWGVFTNWRTFSLNIGELAGASDKEVVPKPKVLVSLDWRPFDFSVFWYGRHVIWIGGWEWKLPLVD